jgi:hypothetical protein
LSGQTLPDCRKHAIRLTSKHVIIRLIDPLDDSIGVDQKRRRNRQGAESSRTDIERISKIELVGYREVGIGQECGPQAVLRLPRSNLLRRVRRDRDQLDPLVIKRRSEFFPSP